MVLGRYVVDAVMLEGRSPSELARSHGISRTWVYELVKRFRMGGYVALEPRSRRPRHCPHQFGPQLEAVIVLLRGQLAAAGHDCGAQTIAQHLRRQGLPVPAVSTVWRILQRHGLITPQLQKRPRSSFVRFEAALPNELWQTDATHWTLEDGRAVEILNLTGHRVLGVEVATPQEVAKHRGADGPGLVVVVDRHRPVRLTVPRVEQDALSPLFEKRSAHSPHGWWLHWLERNAETSSAQGSKSSSHGS